MRWIAGALVATAAAVAVAAPKQDLDAVRDRLETLQGELRESEQTKANVADQVRASEKAIGEANRRLNDLARQRDDLKRQLQELAARSEQARSQITRQQEEIGRMLRAQYVTGRSEPLRVVLDREDPNRKARDLRYLTYVSRARAEVVTGLRANLTAIAELADATAGKQLELASVEREQTAQRRVLEQEKSTRRDVLASVSAQVSMQRQEYATLKRDEERLTRLVEKLARAAARPKPKPKTKSQEKAAANATVPQPGGPSGSFASLKGRLRLPIAGELVGRFGSPRPESGFSAKGVFIRARAGQEVRAIAAGRVVFAEWLRGFGNLVIVDHGDGYMSLYGNNDALSRRPGDEVRAGDALAAVGASAGQEDSGLYFELRHRGRPIDPLSWAPVH